MVFDDQHCHFDHLKQKVKIADIFSYVLCLPSSFFKMADSKSKEPYFDFSGVKIVARTLMYFFFPKNACFRIYDEINGKDPNNPPPYELSVREVKKNIKIRSG